MAESLNSSEHKIKEDYFTSKKKDDIFLLLKELHFPSIFYYL